jgi:hypothetical protein
MGMTKTNSQDAAMISFHNKEPNEDGIHNDEHDDRRRKLVFTDQSQPVHTSTLFLYCRAIKVISGRGLYIGDGIKAGVLAKHGSNTSQNGPRNQIESKPAIEAAEA